MDIESKLKTQILIPDIAVRQFLLRKTGKVGKNIKKAPEITEKAPEVTDPGLEDLKIVIAAEIAKSIIDGDSYLKNSIINTNPNIGSATNSAKSYSHSKKLPPAAKPELSRVVLANVFNKVDVVISKHIVNRHVNADNPDNLNEYATPNKTILQTDEKLFDISDTNLRLFYETLFKEAANKALEIIKQLPAGNAKQDIDSGVKINFDGKQTNEPINPSDPVKSASAYVDIKAANNIDAILDNVRAKNIVKLTKNYAADIKKITKNARYDNSFNPNDSQLTLYNYIDDVKYRSVDKKYIINAPGLEKKGIHTTVEKHNAGYKNVDVTKQKPLNNISSVVFDGRYKSQKIKKRNGENNSEKFKGLDNGLKFNEKNQGKYSVSIDKIELESDPELTSKADNKQFQFLLRAQDSRVKYDRVKDSHAKSHDIKSEVESANPTQQAVQQDAKVSIDTNANFEALIDKTNKRIKKYQQDDVSSLQERVKTKYLANQESRQNLSPLVVAENRTLLYKDVVFKELTPDTPDQPNASNKKYILVEKAAQETPPPKSTTITPQTIATSVVETSTPQTQNQTLQSQIIQPKTVVEIEKKPDGCAKIIIPEVTQKSLAQGLDFLRNYDQTSKTVEGVRPQTKLLIGDCANPKVALSVLIGCLLYNKNADFKNDVKNLIAASIEEHKALYAQCQNIKIPLEKNDIDLLEQAYKKLNVITEPVPQSPPPKSFNSTM